MFAYCGNNPVLGYDPTGSWNWGGFLTGLALVATAVVTAATFGATAPLLVAEIAIATTGAVTAVAAATDSAMVIDVSASAQVGDFYGKAGYSVVVDFGEDGGIYGYGHIGGGTGVSTGVTYSVGLVENFEKPEDYSKDFVDINGSKTVGFDHCFNPTKEYPKTTKATSISFGTGVSGGIGYDYYFSPTVFLKWRNETK